ncbi:hypothetical protein WP7S17E08_P10930 (plasmid) [Klebsiella quasipneumoniae]|nr:hypothetical protein WP7S17E08_P10930 [Klebsiella quasipneumoniae]
MQPDEGLFTRQLPGDRFREQTDPVLQLENINVSFDGFRALTDLSLAIGVGELRCVIGPNGGGQDHPDGRDHRQDPAAKRQSAL